MILIEELTVEYRDCKVQVRVLENLSNPDYDIGVVQVNPEGLQKLKEAGLEPAPLAFPPELERIKADPVAVFGYQRADAFGRPLLLRGSIDADNTPLSVEVNIPGATGGYQTCICFSCRSWEVDKGMSGAPLLNLRTGFVEGIVCAVPGPENIAVGMAKGEKHRYPWGLAVPLSDVQRNWERFADICEVRKRQPIVDESIISQVKEFERHRNFVERPSWKEKVESFLDNNESGYLLLIAGPGAGKSAFMAHCIDKVAAPVFHFIRRDEPGWDDPERMFRSLVAQLVRKYGLSPNQSLIERLESAGTKSDKIRAVAELFSDTLELVSVVLDHRTEREIIWIDGLDEAFGPTGRFRDQPGLPGLFPARLPKGIYIVLSSRPGDHLSWLRDPELCVIEHLDSDKERLAAVADVKRFLEAHAHEVNPPLDPEFIDKVAERTQGNFYIATRILEELKRDPAAPRDARRLPGTVWEFHARTWERVVREARGAGISEGAVREVLGMLAVAQEPLSLEYLQAFGAPEEAEEILGFAGEWFSPRPGYRDPALPFEFNHVSVPEFLLSQLTSGELKELHAKLAAACARWRDFSGKVREYALRYRLSHLVEARNWQGLAEGLADDEFVVERAELEGFGPIHKDVLSTLGVPELPPEWKEAFGFYERFLRFRIERLNSFPRAYAQEVVNEFLSQAPEVLANPLKKLERRVHLRKISGPPTLGALGHIDDVTCVAFSPDGELLASGSRDCTVKIWEARTGELVADCVGHEGCVWSVAFSPDGELLASGSRDRTVKIWEARTGKLVAECTGHKGRVISVAFSPYGELLASVGWDRTVKIWEARTGELVADCVGHEGCVWSVAFSPDGELLASGSRDRTVKIWEARTGRLVAECTGHKGGVISVAFSPDGELLASVDEDGKVKIWEARSGRLGAACTGHEAGFIRVVFSPDGNLLASADEGGEAKIWEARSGRLVAECTGHKDLVWSVAFSPDGRLLASASDDRTVRLWEVKSGRCLSTLFFDAVPKEIAFTSSNPPRLAVATKAEQVFLYELRTPLATHPETVG